MIILNYLDLEQKIEIHDGRSETCHIKTLNSRLEC